MGSENSTAPQDLNADVDWVFESIGKESVFLARLVAQGRPGVKTSKVIYDYGGRSESEILKKRDRLLLKVVDFLKDINAFEPV